MGGWTLEWSLCDPQQCWVEIWDLWVLDGVRDQLCSRQCGGKQEDQMEEERERSLLKTTWVQF